MNNILTTLNTDFAQWSLVLLQLLVGTICGGLIGYQRETHDSPAGFRTHILVCVGSAIFMMVSKIVGASTHDMGRIAAQVASGIGFLGAGTIIKQGSIVRGLTTAASLWAVAAIGLAVGFGGETMAVALIGTIVVFLALSALKNVETRMEHRHHFSLAMTMASPRERVSWLQEQFTTRGVALTSVAITDERDNSAEVTVEGISAGTATVEDVVRELIKLTDVRYVRWYFK